MKCLPIHSLRTKNERTQGERSHVLVACFTCSGDANDVDDAKKAAMEREMMTNRIGGKERKKASTLSQ